MHGRNFTFTANNKGPITGSEFSISTPCISQASEVEFFPSERNVSALNLIGFGKQCFFSHFFLNSWHYQS